MLWGWTGYTETNPDGTPRFWQSNSSRMIMHYASGDAVVELIPETAKLNINTASLDELVRVPAAVSGDPVLARSIAEGILDWRSPAANGGASPQDSFYLSLGPTFRARHASSAARAWYAPSSGAAKSLGARTAGASWKPAIRPSSTFRARTLRWTPCVRAQA